MPLVAAAAQPPQGKALARSGPVKIPGIHPHAAAVEFDCGWVISDTAMLTQTPICSGDLNFDFNINGIYLATVLGNWSPCYEKASGRPQVHRCARSILV